MPQGRGSARGPCRVAELLEDRGGVDGVGVGHVQVPAALGPEVQRQRERPEDLRAKRTETLRLIPVFEVI